MSHPAASTANHLSICCIQGFPFLLFHLYQREIYDTRSVILNNTMKALKILLHIRYVHYSMNKLSEDSGFGGNYIYLKKIDVTNSEKPSTPSNIKEQTKRSLVFQMSSFSMEMLPYVSFFIF